MKVFISWSGTRSRVVAEIMSDWIKCVLQATRPWISTRDIDRGALWFSEIGDQLKDTTIGIICLTQENKTRPWILFEAGALAKGLSSSRVCTFLIDLKSSDIEDPLAQFNHTLPNRNGMWNLLLTLNSSLDSQKLEERILAQVFETYWPQFEQRFKEALEKNPPGEVPTPRSEESILGEILENTRSLSSRVKNLEASEIPGLTSSRWRRVEPKSPASRWQKFLNDLSPVATRWMENAYLRERDGTSVITIHAQDTPDLAVREEIQVTAWAIFGEATNVIYEGIPSQ
jgi:hypothetical protein